MELRGTKFDLKGGAGLGFLAAELRGATYTLVSYIAVSELQYSLKSRPSNEAILISSFPRLLGKGEQQ